MITVRIIHAEAGLSPLQHVLGQALIEKLPLKQKVDRGGAEMLTENRPVEVEEIGEDYTAY